MPVHIAPGKFEYAMKMIKCSHCSTLDKMGNAMKIKTSASVFKSILFAYLVLT